MNKPIVTKYRPLIHPNTLFLDRDGVLNELILRGTVVTSPRALDEIKLSEDINALNFISDWNLVMVTNQPEIIRGNIDLNFVYETNKLISNKVPINEAYICPHQGADNCDCRKPKAGMIDVFRENHLKLNGKECLVGDTRKDMDCATNAKIPFIACRTKYNAQFLSYNRIFINNLWALQFVLDEIL